MTEAEVKTSKKTTSKNGTAKKAKAAGDSPAIGLSQEAIKGVVQIMNRVLSDEYLLYTKLRKYHWNVTGPHFLTLHTSFEDQYEAVEIIIDESAERIRQYGVLSIGTLAEFQKNARLTEKPGDNPDARQMVEDIAGDHEAMIRHLREDIDAIDDEYDDVSAEDYLTQILHVHEKFAWMMRSMLAGSNW